MFDPEPGRLALALHEAADAYAVQALVAAALPGAE